MDDQRTALEKTKETVSYMEELALLLSENGDDYSHLQAYVAPARDFSPMQIKALHDHGNIMLKEHFKPIAARQDPRDILCHAIYDPVAKLSMGMRTMINMMQDDLKEFSGDHTEAMRSLPAEDREEIMRLCYESIEAMRDIAGNYRMMFGKEQPDSMINATLDCYESYADDLELLAPELAAELMINQDDLPHLKSQAADTLNEGKSHIRAIPAEQWKKFGL